VAITEKTSAPVSELPNPELNPMINPMLGRNLGRWAHVYFTSPPDKREEAVTELLRELESERSETPSRPSPESISRIREREQSTKDFKDFLGRSESMFSEPAEPGHLFSQIPDQPHARAELLCPDCSHMNLGDQKYCGHCGSLLSADAQDISLAGSTHRHNPAHVHDDTQWLRERALSSFEQYDGSTRSSGWKHLVLIVLILSAGFAYMRWVQSRPSLATASKPASTSETASAAETVAQTAEPAKPLLDRGTNPGPKQLAKVKPAADDAAQPPVKQNPVPAALRSKEIDAKSSDVPPPAGMTAPGSYEDLLLAQQYLEGRTAARNAPQAARLLWRAVAKQNSDAAVLLSGLYARGDGVPKSCDQARLLLVAAAKKGSAPAAQQLRTFDSYTCR
jgi:hypothetical protein